MRILVISYLFQPNNKIGAVRPTNMSRWLAEMGHEVVVVTNNPAAAEKAGKASVCVVSHSEPIRKMQKKLHDRALARKAAGVRPHEYLSPTTEKKKRRISKEAFYTLRYFLWDWLCQKDWACRCASVMRNELKKDFDVVFSTYGPLGSLFAGRWARRHRYGKVWVSDMRDPIVSEFSLPTVNRYACWLEKQTLRRCDVLTCVSSGALEHYRSRARSAAERDKVCMVENGFEYGAVEKIFLDDEKLHVMYTGQLYARYSDPSALFHAIRELEREGRVPPGHIRIHYAGPHSHEFLSAAAGCDALETVIDHGMLPRDEAVKLQGAADILCVLSWNTRRQQGVLTGKFWEYLRAEKPVLSLVSGELPEAELSCRIQEMKLGFAYEYVRPDPAGLKEYLYQALSCKADHRPVEFQPDREKVLQYRYDNRTKAMERVFAEALGKKTAV